MRKLYYFFITAGKFITIFTFLVLISVCLQSVVLKGKVDYGGRCYQNFNDEFLKDYSYSNIKLSSSNLICNTYYLEYETTLNEKESILFLTSLSKLFYDNNVNCNTHVVLINNNDQYQILSTIVDYKVSYTKTIL